MGALVEGGTTYEMIELSFSPLTTTAATGGSTITEYVLEWAERDLADAVGEWPTGGTIQTLIVNPPTAVFQLDTASAG